MKSAVIMNVDITIMCWLCASRGCAITIETDQGVFVFFRDCAEAQSLGADRNCRLRCLSWFFCFVFVFAVVSFVKVVLHHKYIYEQVRNTFLRLEQCGVGELVIWA